MVSSPRRWRCHCHCPKLRAANLADDLVVRGKSLIQIVKALDVFKENVVPAAMEIETIVEAARGLDVAVCVIGDLVSWMTGWRREISQPSGSRRAAG